MTASGYEIAGFLGVAFYLGSYAALQAGLLRGQGYAYAGLNLAAAVLVLTSLVANFNLWSAIIQISWITISVVGMTRTWIIARGLSLTPEDRAFLAAKFPSLDPVAGRALTRAGTWADAPAGTELTREGEPVPALMYLSEGEAEVSLDGTTVATCGPGTLLGEFGIAARAPALATLRLTSPSRLFSIPAATMEALMRRRPEIRMALDAAIGAEARAKLAASNARAAAHASAAANANLVARDSAASPSSL